MKIRILIYFVFICCINVAHAQIKYLLEQDRVIGCSASYLGSKEVEASQVQVGVSINKRISLGMLYERSFSPPMNLVGLFLEAKIIKPTDAIPYSTQLSFSYGRPSFSRMESASSTYPNMISKVSYGGQIFTISVSEYIYIKVTDNFYTFPSIQFTHSFTTLTSSNFKNKSEQNTLTYSLDLLFQASNTYWLNVSPGVETNKSFTGYVISLALLKIK